MKKHPITLPIPRVAFNNVVKIFSRSNTFVHRFRDSLKAKFPSFSRVRRATFQCIVFAPISRAHFALFARSESRQKALGKPKLSFVASVRWEGRHLTFVERRAIPTGTHPCAPFRKCERKSFGKHSSRTKISGRM